MWVAALASLLLATPGSLQPSRHAVGRAGWDLWASGDVSFGYDRSSFFIKELHSYYRLTSGVELATAITLSAGLRLQFTGDVRSTRDIGDQSWNRLDWLNVIQGGAEVAFIGDLRAAKAIGQFSSLRVAEASVFARWSRIGFYSDVSPVHVPRADRDFTAGGALRLHAEWLPSTRARWRALSLDAGVGGRYQRIDPFLSGFENYRLLEAHGAIACDVLWAADPELDLGPALWIDLTHDFGRRYWNRFDWKNNVTLGVGLAAVYQPISSEGAMPWWRLVRVAGRAGYLRRTYPADTESVPEFRPDDNLILEVESKIVVSPRRR